MTITFTDLPIQDVIALHILPHLPLLQVWELRLLSKSMYQAIQLYMKYFLQLINVTPKEWKEVCPALGIILERSMKLRYLSITSNHYLNSFNSLERSITSLAVSIPDLQELHLQEITFQNSDTIRSLSLATSRLKILRLIEVKGLGKQFDTLLKNTTSLEELVCCGTDISSGFVCTITKQRNLSVLKLSGDCLKDLGAHDFLVVSKLSQLQTLHLEFINCVTDRSIQTIAEFCPKLKYLELRNCLQLSWNVLEYLKKKRIEIKTSSSLPQVKMSREQI